MELREIIKYLKEPFQPEDHEIRELRGKGQWVFLKWQRYRDRLDAVCPEWKVSYSAPLFLDLYCSICCTISIGECSRQAWGTIEVDVKGMRGNVIDNAIAEAFKNAAEAFGVGQYLDNQLLAAEIMWKSKNESTKEDVRRYRRALGIADGTIVRPSQKKEEGSILEAMIPRQEASYVPAPSTCDRSMLIAEIKSLAKRKNLKDDQLDSGARKYHGKAFKDLQDTELIEYRDRISLYVPSSVSS